MRITRWIASRCHTRRGPRHGIAWNPAKRCCDKRSRASRHIRLSRLRNEVASRIFASSLARMNLFRRSVLLVAFTASALAGFAVKHTTPVEGVYAGAITIDAASGAVLFEE